MLDAFLRSNLPFPVRRGKVRDVYDLGQSLLIVATDRISAYDVIMPNGIPDKGKILTALSVFWFRWFDEKRRSPINPPHNDDDHHLISADVKDYPASLRHYG